MSISIENICNMDNLPGLEIVAGAGGKNNIITSGGVADFEFCTDLDSSQFDYYQPNSFVMSSLLFAKNEPEAILPAVKWLKEHDISAFGFKTVFYETLPEEVLTYANEHDFPIVKIPLLTFMDEILFEIIEAVRADNDNFLSEENIQKMIDGDFPKSQLYYCTKNISLKFRDYAICAYIKGDAENFRPNIDRYMNSFYLNSSLTTKALICPYHNGLFAVLTSKHNNPQNFQLILKELLEFLSLEEKDLTIGCSQIYYPYEDLDTCFKESFHTYLASAASGQDFKYYSNIGTYQFLIPHMESKLMRNYMRAYIHPLLDKPELFDTLKEYIICQGEILAVADKLNCHHNTIRYRIAKSKELLNSETLTDQEFYSNVAIAIRLYLLKEANTAN